MKRSTRRRLIGLFVSLFITTTAVIPAAYFAIPHVRRWKRLSDLTSPVAVERERALHYLVRFAEKDPRVRRGAFDAMRAASRDHFLQIARALDKAGLWRHPPAPADVWLRWLEMLAGPARERGPDLPAWLHRLTVAPGRRPVLPWWLRDPAASGKGADESGPILAAQKLAKSDDLARHPRAVALLARLLADPAGDVRYNALVAAAQLAAAPERVPPRLGELIGEATADDAAGIARHAHILCGLLGVEAERASARGRGPDVREAALWAEIRLDPADPGPAIAALRAGDPHQAAAAAYALHQTTAPAAREALAGYVAEHAQPAAIDPGNRAAAWRAILALARLPRSERVAPIPALAAWASRTDASPAGGRSLHLAALFALSRRWGPAPPGIEPVKARLAEPLDDWLGALAAVEGLEAGAAALPVGERLPETLRLAAAAVTKRPRPEPIRGLFASERAPARDRACVIAAKRFPREANRALVADLLRDYNDRAKMSGALLAGLTGARPRAGDGRDLLAARRAAEDVWKVAVLMKLGLWMQGRVPGAREQLFPEQLLTRADLPRTSIVLGMLAKREPEALRFLFNPRGEPRFDLIELFDRHRWWPALRAQLPDDAPPFWVWGDPQLMRFQIDVLRDWALLHPLGEPGPRPARTRPATAEAAARGPEPDGGRPTTETGDRKTEDGEPRSDG